MKSVFIEKFLDSNTLTLYYLSSIVLQRAKEFFKCFRPLEFNVGMQNGQSEKLKSFLSTHYTYVQKIEKGA